MINGEWDFWMVWEMKSRPKVRDEISRFSRTQVNDIYGKLSRKSKFIFSTIWEALSHKGLEIRQKCMVVKAIYILKFVGSVKNFFLRLSPYKQAHTELASSQRETPNAARMAFWILLVRSEPRYGNRIFVNPDNFVNKVEKAND